MGSESKEPGWLTLLRWRNATSAQTLGVATNDPRLHAEVNRASLALVDALEHDDGSISTYLGARR